MERLFIELVIAVALVCGILYFRKKYRNAVIHHRDSAILWQKMMMNIMSAQITKYFEDTNINNHIVCLRNSKIEISIGDNDLLVAVDMDLFKEDINKAFEDAYNRFSINVR